MFFFGNKQNAKRKEKRETLNVKMRSKETRARRVRFAGTLLCVCLSLFLLVMIGWKGIEVGMREMIYSNPRLAIDRIDVETDGVVAPDKIREWARVKHGESLLALDLASLKRDLELRPIVESASAEKILPRQLRITIVERKPVAVVYLFQSATGGAPYGFDRFFLDGAGMVIPPLRRDERNIKADPNPSSLPALLGFDAQKLRPGMCVNSPEIRAALDLIQAYEHSPVASQIEIRSVDLSQPHTLILRTAENSEITFAQENYPRQLARLQTTLDYARREGRLLASLDLAIGNYVPARWQDNSTNSPAVPVLAPQNPKPKKKHV
jgi:cell division protein FtsQ